MKIHKRTVLHMVDKDTKFSVAIFLDNESSKGVWNAFLTEWVTTYIGYPEEVALDQGPQFQSREFKSLLNYVGIKSKDAGVESHNSLGEEERYHAYLRNIYERVHHEHPDMDPKTILKLANKACNDTAGPSGLVPTLLVFGSIPRMPIHPEDLPNQRARMSALHKARSHMSELMAKERLSKAVRSQVPNAVDLQINIGDNVWVYRDDPGKWIRPMRVVDLDNKSVFVNWNGRVTIMSIDRCKPYKTQDEPTDNDIANEPSTLR